MLRAVQVIVWLACLTGAVRCASPGETDRDYWSLRSDLEKAHAARLSNLAARCRGLDLPTQAQRTLDWILPRDPHRRYLFLPSEADPARPGADAPTIVHQWYNKFSQVRRQHAEALFRLAEDELKAGEPTRAYQLLHEVLYEYPDHEKARQILGYRRVNDRWRKPEGVIRSRLMRVSSSALDFAAGQHWVIDSGHFRITTNHSEEAGRRLVEQLEELYDVWQQLFFGYWSNAPSLARRFEGTVSMSRGGKQHQIVLFRNRQEYVERLKRIEPLIEVTVGIYLEARKTAYFYAAEEAKNDIYFHEVAHQLFSETGRVAPGVGTKANAWIIEGVAMYMESLQRREHYYTAGGLDANRLQYARFRRLNEGFYVPLEELVSLDRRTLQQHEEIRRLYSQSAGLATFLMDYDRGRYRRALTDYLQAVYQGRDSAPTLASLVDRPLAELDEQYVRFLNVTDEDLAHLAAFPQATSLALGRTSVTDAGLKHLAGHTQLEWLDLAYTNVGDQGLANLKAATRLNHLIVEHTGITDAALEVIGQFRELEILDLTGTGITDEGLVHLGSLSQLKELWLGETKITDAGLVHLASLKKLETLDVGRTRVTLEGWNRLKNALPSLQTEASAQP
jgi:hypothetical protein